MRKQSKGPEHTPRSLVAFVESKRGKDCPVCALPKEITEEIRMSANRHRFPLAVVLEWLRVEHGIRITREQYMVHAQGGHVWRRKAK